MVKCNSSQEHQCIKDTVREDMIEVFSRTAFHQEICAVFSRRCPARGYNCGCTSVWREVSESTLSHCPRTHDSWHRVKCTKVRGMETLWNSLVCIIYSFIETIYYLPYSGRPILSIQSSPVISQSFFFCHAGSPPKSSRYPRPTKAILLIDRRTDSQQKTPSMHVRLSNHCNSAPIAIFINLVGSWCSVDDDPRDLVCRLKGCCCGLCVCFGLVDDALNYSLLVGVKICGERFV